MKKELWSWQWKGGGFNSCFATSKDDAIRQAKEMGLPRPHSTVNLYLIPDENTFSNNPEEYDRLCRAYSMD